MRQKTIEMLKKVSYELTKREYVTAQDLQQITGLKNYSIYRIIKFMRLEGIGIIATKKGYILSKYAKQKDDVTFIRRLYGRRTSDLIALRAAESDIQKRWKNDKIDSQNMDGVLSYLHPKSIAIEKKAEDGMKYLLTTDRK